MSKRPRILLVGVCAALALLTTQGGVNRVAHCGDGTSKVIATCIDIVTCDDECGPDCNTFCRDRLCPSAECTTPCG